MKRQLTIIIGITLAAVLPLMAQDVNDMNDVNDVNIVVEASQAIDLSAIEEPETLESKYHLILDRNIFSKNRRVDGVIVIPERNDPPPAPIETYYALVGITKENDLTVAFIENTSRRQIDKYTVKSKVARGEITDLTLDTLNYSYQSDPNDPNAIEEVTVNLGQNLLGYTAQLSGGTGRPRTETRRTQNNTRNRNTRTRDTNMNTNMRGGFDMGGRTGFDMGGRTGRGGRGGRGGFDMGGFDMGGAMDMLQGMGGFGGNTTTTSAPVENLSEEEEADILRRMMERRESE